MDIADAIVKAAHIISNNGALTEHGTELGGLEAHSMKIAESINGLASAFEEIAHQMSRIADSIEENRNA
jgi:hypothetical protein